MNENYRSDKFLPTMSGSDFGSAMALVEIIRLLTAIDKKMYVVIKKLEDPSGSSEKSDPTVYAEDMGYQAPDSDEAETHDLSDK